MLCYIMLFNIKYAMCFNIQYLLQILHLSCQIQRLPSYHAPWSVLLRNRMAEQMNVFFCLLFKKCIIKQLLNSVFA